MRTPLLIAFIGLTTTAFAQEQESKFLDRLLRPNMALSNSAQNKKFNGATNASVTKSASTKTFYTRSAARQKEFGGQRSFFARVFGTRKYSGERAADVSTRSIHPEHSATFATQNSAMPRQAKEEGRTQEATQFAGNREFFPSGKSQKALDQHRKEMTVEEVRELLNRNK